MEGFENTMMWPILKSAVLLAIFLKVVYMSNWLFGTMICFVILLGY